MATVFFFQVEDDAIVKSGMSIGQDGGIGYAEFDPEGGTLTFPELNIGSSMVYMRYQSEKSVSLELAGRTINLAATGDDWNYVEISNNFRTDQGVTQYSLGPNDASLKIDKVFINAAQNQPYLFNEASSSELNEITRVDGSSRFDNPCGSSMSWTWQNHSDPEMNIPDYYFYVEFELKSDADQIILLTFQGQQQIIRISPSDSWQYLGKVFSKGRSRKLHPFIYDGNSRR